MDRIQRACGTLNRHSHTEAHPKILCEETRPASHLQKLLCSLQIMTKVLLIPQLVQAPPFCLLGPLPGQDPLGVPAQVRGLPQGHLLSLFAGVGSQGSCVEGGLRDLGAGSPEHGGRGWASGGTQGLRSWHGHGLGPPYGLYPPPVPSVEGADSSPIFYFWKFTGCGISAQSHWCCVLDFFLCFQIFF